MAHNLTDVDVFTSAVTVPDGGDPRTAASVEVPFQALANRTLNVKNKVDNLGVTGGLTVTHSSGIKTTAGPITAAGDIRAVADFEYCDSAGAFARKERIVMVPLSSSTPDWTLFNGNLWSTKAGPYPVDIPLHMLKRDCSVDMIRVAFTSAVAGAAPSFKLYQKNAGKTAPPSSSLTERASDLSSGGTAGNTSTTPQIMSSGNTVAIGAAFTESEEWFVRVSGHHLDDKILWIELTMNDAGPRNA